MSRQGEDKSSAAFSRFFLLFVLCGKWSTLTHPPSLLNLKNPCSVYVVDRHVLLEAADLQSLETLESGLPPHLRESAVVERLAPSAPSTAVAAAAAATTASANDAPAAAPAQSSETSRSSRRQRRPPAQV